MLQPSFATAEVRHCFNRNGGAAKCVERWRAPRSVIAARAMDPSHGCVAVTTLARKREAQLANGLARNIDGQGLGRGRPLSGARAH